MPASPSTRSGPPNDARRARARALPPDERRAAIVAAALPLLLRDGGGVTTKQIAVAAGIAEGTIFRVFADKDALVAAVVAEAFDPAPTAEALAMISLGLPLEERLAAAVEVLQRRVTVIWQLMTAAGVDRPPPGHAPSIRRRDAPDVRALTRLFTGDEGVLCCDAADAADRLRSVTYACSLPFLVGDEPMAPAEVVTLLLDGIRRREKRN